MLAHERTGSGPPLLLLHGTNSSRRVWDPILPALAARCEVIAVDLPAHGGSPPTCHAPPAFALEVAALLDALGHDRLPVVGHSVGGWTALELALLGRARSVVALAPAGLWRRHSPPFTDTLLLVNWSLGRLLGDAFVTAPLRSRLGRRLALAQISGRPAEVPAQVAIGTARTVRASTHFPRHFRETRRQRFTGGARIAADVPILIVWGSQDRIARRSTSQHTDQLPAHSAVETWAGCGHMLMWDAPERTIAAALAASGGAPVPS